VNQSRPEYSYHDLQARDYDGYHMESMLNDAFRSNDININDGQNANIEAFYMQYAPFGTITFEGSKTHSELSATVGLLSIKSEQNMSHRRFDNVLRLM